MSRDTRIEASLTGPAIDGATPAGFTEYRIDDRGRKRLERLKLSSVNLPQGTVLTVTVNNTALRNLTLNPLCIASFDIDSNDGQSVPTINSW